MYYYLLVSLISVFRFILFYFLVDSARAMHMIVWLEGLDIFKYLFLEIEKKGFLHELGSYLLGN